MECECVLARALFFYARGRGRGFGGGKGGKGRALSKLRADFNISPVMGEEEGLLAMSFLETLVNISVKRRCGPRANRNPARKLFPGVRAGCIGPWRKKGGNERRGRVGGTDRVSLGARGEDKYTHRVLEFHL